MLLLDVNCFIRCEFCLYNFVLCNYDFERKHSEKLGEEVSLEEEVSKGEMSLEEIAGELFEE